MSEISAEIEIRSQLWKFIRGALLISEFEDWAYGHALLESTLGADLYFILITTRFTDSYSVESLRKRLASFAKAKWPLECQCITLCDNDVVDIGQASEHVFHTLHEMKQRGQPLWWLSIYRCESCEQWWLVAQEERQNDIFCMKRMSTAEAQSTLERDEWPSEFDSIYQLLRIGLDANKRVTFADPLGDCSLVNTIRDIAQEKPGIGLKEIALLLNLESHIARELTRRIQRKWKLEINVNA